MSINLVTGGSGFLLAIDPGKATGLAAITWDDPTNLLVEEVEGRFALAARIRQFISSGAIPEIVAESFTISQRTIKTTQDHNALRILGWLDIECERLGISYYTQTATQAKKYTSDEKLKAIGWWNPTPDGHQNDATRHLFRHLVFKHQEVVAPMVRSMMEVLNA